MRTLGESRHKWMRHVTSECVTAIVNELFRCIWMRHATAHWIVSCCRPRRVCCSAMQYVAVCCSVLQCVAVCCRVLQCVAVRCRVLPCVAMCYSVLQCVAVRCSVLRQAMQSTIHMSLVPWLTHSVGMHSRRVTAHANESCRIWTHQLYTNSALPLAMRVTTLYVTWSRGSVYTICGKHDHVGMLL